MLSAASLISRHGFPDAQSLPQRHRGTGARVEPHGTRHRPARRPGGEARDLCACQRRGRPPRRSRLSPPRRRTPGVRGGDRLPATAQHLARTLEPGVRHRRLRGRRRHRSPRSFSRIPLFILHTQGLAPVWLGLLGVLGAIPAIDAAVALVNRGVTRGFGATLLPALELRGGVPVAFAYARRGADAADDAGGDRGADRASGGSPPGESGGRSAFRSALRLAGCRDRACRRRRSAAASGDGGHRPAQSALRPGARRRPLPAAPSPAGLERRRSAVDRLGTQARQAARAEPAAARRDRHHVPRPSAGSRRRCRPAFAMSSRSTPTPGCRATRSAG